jgi:hypothetical protein
VTVGEMKEDLRQALKVKEIELDEAVELWIEIDSKAAEKGAANINEDIQVDNIHALKSMLPKVDPKSKLQQIKITS